MGLRLPKTRGMLRREAANWLARLQSGRDPDVERKFEQWRADPRHAEAFERVHRSYEQAGLLRHSPIAAAGQLQPTPSEPEWKLRPALAAAAAVVLLIPISVLLVRGGSPFGGTDAVMLMTRVGEIRQVTLADGSRVTLDTATRVDVDIGRSRRSAHVRSGRARFQVAASNIPFVIETATSKVTTQHGMVDVEQVGQTSRVDVLAGAADIRGSGAGQASSTALSAGQAVTVRPEGLGQKAALSTGPDWTRGMLQFDGTPLPDAVALANRYSERHIILAGDLPALKVTGAFRAGDTVGLAKALAAAFDLSFQRSADGNLLLSRNASSTQEKKKGG
ncbi:MAG: FecR family protein [Bacillota bacterium]